jgi:hypothetical protein
MFYLREIPMFMKHAQEHGGGIGGMLAGGKDMLLSKMLFEPFMSRGTTAAISASRSLTPMPQATSRSSRRFKAHRQSAIVADVGVGRAADRRIDARRA